MPILYESTERVVREHESLPEFLLGGFLGFLTGAVVFTSVGRELAKRAIRLGAEVTKEEVERWLKKGEEKLRELKERE